MSGGYDLHTHSNASDGTLAPADLVQRAAAAGVRVLALTDHDTTAGVAEAERAAGKLDLVLVSGVEVSVTWNSTTVHIVGLGVRPSDAGLQAGLARLREFRVWRAVEIGRRLEKAGIPGAYEGARALSGGELIARPHFARFLVEKGYAGGMSDVFRRFLVRGRPGHVPGDWASLEEALGWIHGAGGQAVIAHPARYRFTRTKLRRLIGEFRECGGEAMEVVSGSHSRDEMFTMANHARECGLLASAGSDYHGPGNHYLSLGQLPPLPRGCLPVWKDWKLSAGANYEF
ncbi:MAG: PHP domain-containing protein [Pseudomonadota bacterium]